MTRKLRFTGSCAAWLWRFVRLVLWLVWLPFFAMMMVALFGAALLATLIYPGEWKNGTWTRKQ